MWRIKHMEVQNEFKFKSSSIEPPELLVILKALEEYRRSAGLAKLELVCSDVMRDLATEFKFNAIDCLVGVEPNTTLIDIDELSKRVRDSDPLNMSLSSNLRELCRAKTSGQISTIPVDTPFSFGKYTRLGDSISIVSGIEAYCSANNIENISLVSTATIRDVLDNFCTSHIQLVECCKFASPQLELLYGQASWQTPWLKRFSNALFSSFGGQLPAEVKPLKLKYEVALNPELQNVIYCQYDSRSHNISSMPELVKQIECLFTDKEIRVIGGKDTPTYLGNNYKYDLGSLKEIIERLSNCYCFLGCDSGIAHLAGILGKPSVVINFSEFESVFHFFRSYHKTVVIDRRLFEVQSK
jgi:hypothetical protein